MASPELKSLESKFDKSDDYLLLRRLSNCDTITDFDSRSELPELHGLIVDVEAAINRYDSTDIKVFELALLPFSFNKAGEVIEIGQAYSGLQDIGEPLGDELIALTGITDADISGQKLNVSQINSMLSKSNIVISHSASFDRPLCEGVSSCFADSHWGCSISDVDWTANGYESNKLEYLCMKNGFFYKPHRAEEDCRALLHLLTIKQSSFQNDPSLKVLLDNAREPVYRIYVPGVPYTKNQLMRQRGYSWMPDNRGPYPKSWYIDLNEMLHFREVEYLKAVVITGSSEPIVKKITTRDRYSARI